MGCHFLLHRIFPTQGWNPGLPHCRQTLYHLSHQGSTAQLLSHVQLFATPSTVIHQAPLSTGFPRQEYWSGLPFPPPGWEANPGIKPTSPVSPALAGRFFITRDTWEALGGRLIIPGREGVSNFKCSLYWHLTSLNLQLLGCRTKTHLIGSTA